jgi:uncharacterized protein involved in oxidation of intracellular sulfur
MHDGGAMNIVFVLNEAPYGSERCYNALRLAGALAKASSNEVRVFLLGDGAACAKAGQKVPEGFYNVQVMLDRILRRDGQVGVCGTCMDARGIAPGDLAEGVRRSSLDDLVAWTEWADQVLVF